MFDILPPIENSRRIEPIRPSIAFLERADELRQLLENPLLGNFLTAERIRARCHILRPQLQAEFIREFVLSPDERGRARRDY
jgi:hypothetical protein